MATASSNRDPGEHGTAPAAASTELAPDELGDATGAALALDDIERLQARTHIDYPLTPWWVHPTIGVGLGAMILALRVGPVAVGELRRPLLVLVIAYLAVVLLGLTMAYGVNAVVGAAIIAIGVTLASLSYDRAYGRATTLVRRRLSLT